MALLLDPTSSRETAPQAATGLNSGAVVLPRTQRGTARPSFPFRALAAADLVAVGAGLAVGGGKGLVLAAPAALGAFALAGAYRRRALRHATATDLPMLVGTLSVVLLALATVGLIGQDALLHGWAGAALALVILRGGVAGAHREYRRRRPVPAIIVGHGIIGSRLAERLGEHPELGLRAVGVLDDRPAQVQGGPVLPLLGGLGALEEVVRRTGAGHVLVAFSQTRDAELYGLADRCAALGVRISVVPRCFDAVNERATMDYLGALPIMHLDPTDTRSSTFSLKHLVGRVLATTALVVIAPLFAALAIAVKLSGPGPIFFRQRRVGRDGHDFDLLKFRSMAMAPADGDGFRPERGSAPGGVEGQDRRTRVGAFLRRTSLDELPQLLNVAKGDMAIVGPRPERPEYVALFLDEITRYDDRHRVKSGITGWAQVHGLRGKTSISKRVEWDNYYIENHSVWLDLRILAMTVRAVFKGAE